MADLMRRRDREKKEIDGASIRYQPKRIGEQTHQSG
jgi:hypothetical protein